jgi:hypothetical protein
VAVAAAGAHFAAPIALLDQGPPQPMAMPPDAAPPGATLLRADSRPPAAATAGAPPGPTPECVYDNYFPLDDFGSPASQKDVVYPFFAEAADDFILLGDPTNPCDVDRIKFGVTFFNVPAGVTPDPFSCWTSIKVTIYEDITSGPPSTDPNCQITKGPAGYPDETVLPFRDHVECFPGSVVCELKIPMSDVNVIVTPLPSSCTPAGFSYEVLLVGLSGQCILEKNRKYWIAIAPEQDFTVCGQTAIMLSQFNVEHPAMQFFPLAGIAPWAPIGGNQDGCPPTTPPAGTARDLAIQIIAFKVDVQEPNCPADCGVLDKAVDIQDLLALLAQWNGPGPCDINGDGIVNIIDLLALLSAWGPCPTPPNDECEDKITITAVPDQPINLAVDMRGSTPGDPNDPNFCPPVCVEPEKDVWYCVVYGGNEPGIMTISTTFDVFIEIYDRCDCIWPPDLKACAPGLVGATTPILPGQSCCVRLINWVGLPNEELKGRMDIVIVPDIRLGACCLPSGVCLDGTLETDCLGQGGQWFSNQFCNDIVCEPVRFGACCIPGGPCLDATLETDCLDQGGFWFGNRSCQDVDDCLPGARNCPPGSNYGQRPSQPTEPWGLGTSDLRPALKRYENFPLFQDTIVSSLWFWGADARFGPPGFEECNDPAPRFDVVIYPDDGTGHPVKTQPFCQFFGVPAREKNFKAFYVDAAGQNIAVWQYKVNIDCFLPPGEWWVSIQGVGGQTPDCWFLWLSSPEGDGMSVFEDQNTGGQTDEPFDLSLCINRSGGGPGFDCEFCPFPPAEGGEECIQPELNCLYEILTVTGSCNDPTCVPGNFLCASPCPPTQSEFCPGPIVTFFVGGPTGCIIEAMLVDPFCQTCPPDACRLLITDPSW